MIKGIALWGTAENAEQVQAAIDKLVAMGKLRRYVVRGQTYLHITGWSKHQRVDKPGRPLVPRESEGEPSNCNVRESVANPSRESREPLATDLDQRPTTTTSTNDPEPVAAGSSGDQGESIAVLVTHAYAELNAERKAIDPTASDCQPMTERPLVDRLMAHRPKTDRRRALEHALAVLKARARAAGKVDDLRMAFLGGERSWLMLLDGSAKSTKGRDGPAGAVRGQAPAIVTQRPDGEQPI